MYKLGLFQCRGWGNYGVYDDTKIIKMDEDVPIISPDGLMIGSENGWDSTGIEFNDDWINKAIELMNERK